MNTNSRTPLTLALVALLTGSALVAGTVGASVGATTHTVTQTTTTLPGGLTGAHVNTGITGSTGVTGSAGAVGVNSSTNSSANASANGSATGQTGDLNVAAQAAGTDHDTIGMRAERADARADAFASDDMKMVTHVDSDIRASEFAEREKVDATVRKNVEETRARVATDEARVTTTSRDRFDAAKADLSAREMALSDSLKAAGAATKESWESARADVAMNYSLYASAAMRTRVIAASGSASASGALESGATVAAIRSSDAATKARVETDVNEKLSASEKAMASTEARAKDLSGDAKESYLAAKRAIAHRERELKHTLVAAERASSSDWEHARTDVAVAYANYTEAVSRAELAASVRGSGTVAANSSSLKAASNGTLAATEHN